MSIPHNYIFFLHLVHSMVIHMNSTSNDSETANEVGLICVENGRSHTLVALRSTHMFRTCSVYFVMLAVSKVWRYVCF